MSVYPKSRINEMVGFLLIALTFFLFLSLISYHPLDPSLNVSSPERVYQNIIGQAGAWVSDFLFQIFGLAALLLPIPLLFLGYKMIRARKIDYPYLKAFGFLCTLLSVSAGFSLSGLSIPISTNFTSGGLLGYILSEQLRNHLNLTGSLLVVTTAFVVSLIITTRFSLDATLDWLSKRKWNVFDGFFSRYQTWQKHRDDRKELERFRSNQSDLVNRSLPRRGRAAVVKQGQQEDAGSTTPEIVPGVGASLSGETAAGALPEEPPVLPIPEEPYRPPSLDFLQEPEAEGYIDEDELRERAEKLSMKCAEFDVRGRVLQIHPGPVVTTFEFKPDPGIKYSRITNLTDDLCLALKAESIRIDRVPGKNTVGIEVPNRERRTILLRETLASPEFRQAPSKLTLGIGQLIDGRAYVADLARMPHLLIAGSTGTGKSVGVNCMVCSILYKASPKEVRFIMVDPKRLELGLYADIPHLLTPIVTDPKKAANALNWAVRTMEKRYRLLAEHGVRNISQFNLLVNELEEDDDLETLAHIVIIVDELADLMMTAGKEVELAVTRLAQMARAVGIHLILATQRPSVDVITGLIKANFPTRISFRVSSKVDSRTILDSNGAEQLLGLGDMLFLSPETSRLVRIHGGFISEKEIAKIVAFLKEQSKPELQEEILMGLADEEEGTQVTPSDMEDKLYDEAARFVVEARKASTSLLQRRFRIGYGRAARLLDVLEHDGIVGPPDGSKPRQILVPPTYYEEVDASE